MASQTRTGTPPVDRFSADRGKRHRSLAESVRNRDFGKAVLGEMVVDRLGDEALHGRPASRASNFSWVRTGLGKYALTATFPILLA